MSRTLGRTAPVLIGVVGISSVAAQPQYQLIDLGTLGGTTSAANGISENGIVAGYAVLPDGKHPVLWDSNEVVDLGAPPGFTTGEAVAVNDAGQVAVFGENSPQAYGAFFWENGIWTALPPLAGQPESLAEDINNAGQVVGRSFTLGAGDERPVLWDQGTVTNLGTLGGAGGYTIAFGINDAGQIVGISETNPGGSFADRRFRAFLWRDGVMTNLGVLPGEVESSALEINDRGEVAGESWHLTFPQFFSAHQATLWRGEGEEIVDLGLTPAGLPGPCTFEFPFWNANQARAVNNCGQVVGSANCVGGGSPEAAFLWQDGVNHHLNDLVRTGADLNLLNAKDINDAGQIVGVGINAAGQLRAFLLEPLGGPACAPLPGDLDGDGGVDLDDLTLLLQDFGCVDVGCSSDVDGDGDTDLDDLTLLLQNFGS